MIQRYSRAEMREIWTEQRKLEIWLQIELLAAEALVAEGIVPEKDFAQMKAKAAFNIDRCKELEKTLNHDVIAFTTNVAENIGAPASRWLHFGLTSSDIIDTAFAVQMVQSADMLIERCQGACARSSPQSATSIKFTPMIGRSHGIHAEPTTFGLKMALMHDEFARALRRLEARPGNGGGGKTFRGRRHQRASAAAGRGILFAGNSAFGPRPSPRRWWPRDLHAEFIGVAGLDRRRASNAGPPNSAICNGPKFWRRKNSLPGGKRGPAPCRTSATPSPANA